MDQAETAAAVNALDAVSPELVLVSPQLRRPDGGATLEDSILAGQALSERDLARLLAAQMELPFVDLEHSRLDAAATELLTEDDARMYSALPVALAEGRVLLAVARPTNEPAIRRVAEKLDRHIDLAVATRTDLLRAIERAYSSVVELPAAEPPVRESGPVEGVSGEPGGSAATAATVEKPDPPPAAVETPVLPAAKPRQWHRRLLVAAALVAAAPLTALGGNVTAQILDERPEPRTFGPPPAARPFPGAEEWAWPAGKPGGELPLSPAFRRRLDQAARRAHIEPALLRAAIRARRGGGSPDLDRIARRLRGPEPWLALIALEGRTGYADRALALSRYYSSAGAVDDRVQLPEGGGAQIASGLVDRRLVAALGYLAKTMGGVRVVSVAEPHVDLAAPLAVAHARGRAVAIDVDGEDDHGSRLQRAIRELLLLPPELQPKRLVSVLRLGRPAELHIAY